LQPAIPNPLYLQIIFKVEAILNLASPHVGPLSDPPHPRGLDLKNTLEDLTDELVEVVS
jgi:hypothetical protein